MAEEAKNLEPEKQNEPQAPPKPKTWKDKVFNLYLPLMALMFSSPIIYYYDEKKDLSFWGFLAYTGMGLLFTYGYLDSAGFLDKPHLQEKKKKLEDGFEKAFEWVVESILKIIGYGILLAVVAGIGYMVFGVLGSLSVSTLLIIIIVILLLKQPRPKCQ